MSAGTAGSRNAGRLGLILLLATSPAVASAQPPERLADGVALALGARRLEVRVCRDDLVRVVDAVPGPFFARQSLVTVASACEPTPFEVKTGSGGLDVTTKRVTARIALAERRRELPRP